MIRIQRSSRRRGRNFAIPESDSEAEKDDTGIIAIRPSLLDNRETVVSYVLCNVLQSKSVMDMTK